MWFWFFYDPLTMIALMIAYIVGFVALQFIAMKIAPRVAASLAGRMSLYTAMLLTTLLIIGGGALTAYALYAVAAAYGYHLYVEWLLGFLLVMSLVSYLFAPWMINLAYRARPSPELQEIVNEAAARAGIRKPPRAVVVEGPPNAFAYGNFLAGRYVAVSRSLYEMLSRDELLSVIGHELGHHKHRDTVIIMLLGLVPSLLYYMGVFLIRAGLWGSMSGDREEGNSGLVLAALGILGVIVSFVMQVAVLAFSRLREYYADAHGAFVAGVKPMQRALAKLHLYYSTPRGQQRLQELHKSSIKALFIYAFTSTLANPFYEPSWNRRGFYDIDRVVEELKRAKVDPSEEIFSDHPPIPKRLRFLDQLEAMNIRP